MNKTLYFDAETEKKLRALCECHSTSMSGVIRMLVRDAHQTAIKVEAEAIVMPSDRLFKRMKSKRLEKYGN